MAPQDPAALTLRNSQTLRTENTLLREQLAAVTKIGLALSSEHDLRSLLETILTTARSLTCADAAGCF